MQSDAAISGAEMLRFLVDICRGMAHLHQSQIIHRNLAAHKILLGKDNVAKVSDFTISPLESFRHSDTGPLKWMSNEAIRERTYSTKSDIW